MSTNLSLAETISQALKSNTNPNQNTKCVPLGSPGAQTFGRTCTPTLALNSALLGVHCTVVSSDFVLTQELNLTLAMDLILRGGTP